MQERRPLSDDSVLMRWMRTEINKMNEGIVFERKSLTQLLQEEKPSAKTKADKDHFFEIATLKKLGEKLPEKLQDKLKLPCCSSLITKSQTAATLTIHMLWKLYRLWERSAACAQCSRVGYGWQINILHNMKKYPTAVQIVMG
jgi:hypothetical protein